MLQQLGYTTWLSYLQSCDCRFIGRWNYESSGVESCPACRTHSLTAERSVISDQFSTSRDILNTGGSAESTTRTHSLRPWDKRYLSHLIWLLCMHCCLCIKHLKVSLGRYLVRFITILTQTPWICYDIQWEEFRDCLLSIAELGT